MNEQLQELIRVAKATGYERQEADVNALLCTVENWSAFEIKQAIAYMSANPNPKS